MFKYLLMFTSILCGTSLIFSTASAEDPPKTTTAIPNDTTLSKDDWLKSIKQSLPDLICKDFQNDPQLKKQLDDIKMTYDQCVAVIPESFDKCQQKLYASIPDQINDNSLSVWGRSLGECIGTDFALKYLFPKSN
ncbi:MAG: hypothetical protein HYX60_09390 [Legionella longbeachae]|nr:hypothetical protein [Legionella longbeachae]